jgi:DNA-binding SARP family transcriptional activator
MSTIRIHLFGRFEIYSDEHLVVPFHCQKAMELLCFLLLYRDKPHFREKLAETFWGSRSTAESKKYFRKTLWQLQHTIGDWFLPDEGNILTISEDWLELSPPGSLWLDVDEFERILAILVNQRGEELSQRDYQLARSAAALYRGKLLENCYQDWLTYERERLEDLYFILIEKIIDYCETHGLFQEGICYGRSLLEIDSSHEATYQSLMRLYCATGNRTSAIRLFEACRDMLKIEFNIEPSETTLCIYRQIVSNKEMFPEPPSVSIQPDSMHDHSNIRAALEEIKALVAWQDTVQKQLLNKIHLLESALD